MAARSVITIGIFDGVHLGHASLLRHAREAAGAAGRVIAMAFEPHPATQLDPETAPAVLTTWSQREALLREAGADEVRRLEPTPALLGSTPETFLDQLIQNHEPQVLVEGADFRFGRGRAGTIDTLRDLASARGVETIVVEPVDGVLDDLSLVRISSSLIRWLVRRGRVHDARRLLGRPWEVHGEVEPGEGRGRDLGVRTANLALNGYERLADGVYAGRARFPDASWRPAAICMGSRPTFEVDGPPVLEVHLLEGDADESYGRMLEVRLEHWLRDVVAYPDAGALVDQVRRDIARTRSLYVPEGSPA